jgi:hypothetical protein
MPPGGNASGSQHSKLVRIDLLPSVARDLVEHERQARWTGARWRSIQPPAWRDGMITFIRTTTAAPGKIGDLLEFSHKVTEIIGRVTGEKPAVAMSFGGQTNQIAWISVAPSLGAVEQTFGKLMASAEYRDVLKAVEHLIVPGSTHDQVWIHV